MLKKTVLSICAIWITLAAIVIIRYLNPSTTNLSTNIENTDLDSTQIQTQVIATGLHVPRTIVFADTNRILVTERNGNLRQIINGVLQDTPLITIPYISTNSEEWLMGMALDPNYATNKYIYLCYAYTDSNSMFVRVAQWTDAWDKIINEKILIDKLPGAPNHAWCALAFWPDNKLYITIGDAIEWEKAQYPDYFNGKILRINSDGSNPMDNPYPRSAVRSIGHRNSQGIDRDSKNNMYASEHGPSVFDGQPGGDEINRILPKGNYGRNKISHEQTATGFINPIAIFTPAIAPGSLYIYKGTMFPQRKDHILIGMLRGQWLLRIQIDANNPDKIIAQEKIIDKTFWRVRYVTEWPDGSIYITTSNTDGRGNEQENDDKIIRIYKK